MGVSQTAVSRMEQPHNLLLSTLNSYLQAVGVTARMIVRFADGNEATLNNSGPSQGYRSSLACRASR